MMYIVAFVDRVNVGFAKQHLQAATGMSEAAFALGASLFFISYFLCEVPSNLALARFGARMWMCRIMVVWGLVSAATMFVQGNTSFYIIRLLLGAAEAGFFPGVILYLTYWFPAHRRMTMLGLFYFGAALSFVLGAPLSGMLLQLEGVLGLACWQWMFLIEGLASSIVGVWAFFYLDDKPASARWLTVDEKRELTAVLEVEDHGKVEHGPNGIFSSLRDATVLRFIGIYILPQMSVAVLVFHLPSQIARLVDQNAGLMFGLAVAIPWACAVVAVAVVPRWAEQVKSACVRCGEFVVAAIGMVGLSSSSPIIAMAAACLAVAGLWAVQPIFWQALTTYLGGIAAVAGIALVNVGGFISPNVRAWANDAFATPNAGLFLLAITTLIAALLLTLRHKTSDVGVPLGPVLGEP